MNKIAKFFKDRVKLNLIIDIILFLLLMTMAGIGFLIKYTLISGEKQNIIYGTNTNLEFWGLDRHEWGTIHLIVSIIFVVFILLHIILHWKMIVCFLKRLIPNKTYRVIFSAFVSLFGLLLFIFGFVVTPEQVGHKNLYRHHISNKVSVTNSTLNKNSETFNRKQRKAIDTTATIQPKQKQRHFKNKKHVEKYKVFGNQSMSYVSDKYDVPISYICKELGISSNYKSEKLGRLRKRFNFTMSDVSHAIAKYKNKNVQ